MIDHRLRHAETNDSKTWAKKLQDFLAKLDNEVKNKKVKKYQRDKKDYIGGKTYNWQKVEKVTNSNNTSLNNEVEEVVDPVQVKPLGAPTTTTKKYRNLYLQAMPKRSPPRKNLIKDQHPTPTNHLWANIIGHGEEGQRVEDEVTMVKMMDPHNGRGNGMTGGSPSDPRCWFFR